MSDNKSIFQICREKDVEESAFQSDDSDAPEALINSIKSSCLNRNTSISNSGSPKDVHHEENQIKSNNYYKLIHFSIQKRKNELKEKMKLEEKKLVENEMTIAISSNEQLVQSQVILNKNLEFPSNRFEEIVNDEWQNVGVNNAQNHNLDEPNNNSEIQNDIQMEDQIDKKSDVQEINDKNEQPPNEIMNVENNHIDAQQNNKVIEPMLNEILNNLNNQDNAAENNDEIVPVNNQIQENEEIPGNVNVNNGEIVPVRHQIQVNEEILGNSNINNREIVPVHNKIQVNVNIPHYLNVNNGENVPVHNQFQINVNIPHYLNVINRGIVPVHNQIQVNVNIPENLNVINREIVPVHNQIQAIENIHENDQMEEQNIDEDKEETKSYQSEELEYSKPEDINLEQPQKKEMIPIGLVMKHINSMINEKNCGIVRKDIKRKIFKLATSLGNPKGNIPEVLLRDYEKSYFLDSEKESKATGLNWLAGDLKKTRLQSKRANLEELERYKNTSYEIEKEVLEGIIDSFTLKENKQMKNAKSNHGKFQRKRLVKGTDDVSSNISGIETDSEKNHPLKFAEYKPEWEKRVYNEGRKEELKGKTKEHVIDEQAVDVDMEDAINKRKETKVNSKKNQKNERKRKNETNNLPKGKKGRKVSRKEKKEKKTKKREVKAKEKEVRLQHSDVEENSEENTLIISTEENTEIENPTVIDSGSDMESIIEYEDGPQYIKERESQISDRYVGPNPEQAIPVEPKPKKKNEELKQWEKIDKFMNEEREIFECNQVQESLLFHSENRRIIENRIKKIPAPHFDLHSHKESFKTDFIEFKNEKCDELGKDHIFYSKKSIVFIQAGTEHWLQFCFNIWGLLSVLNSKVATLSHLKLFNALLEMFAMYNPCLPVERALQTDIHDRDVYLRGDKQKDIKKENKRKANEKYQPQRKKLNDQRKQEKNKKGIEELKDEKKNENKVDDNQNEGEDSLVDYQLDGFNTDKMVEEVGGIKSLIEDVYKKVLNEEETTNKNNYREMSNDEFREFMRK